MLIEMVTRLVKLQIVALSTPGNPNRTPKVAGIAAKLYSREIAFVFTEKSARLLFVENILVRWNVRGKRVIGYYRGVHFI